MLVKCAIKLLTVFGLKWLHFVFFCAASGSYQQADAAGAAVGWREALQAQAGDGCRARDIAQGEATTSLG